MSQATLHNQPLTFTAEQTQQLDRCLLRLADHTGSPLAMISDVSGHLLLHRGRLSLAQSTGLSALAAGGFAAGLEIGRFLGLNDKNSFKRQLLEGKLANLYIMAVGSELLLITAFTQQTTLGLVRLFAEQAQQELLTLAQEASIAREEALAKAPIQIDEGLGEEVGRQLDELFAGGLG